jgi:hypothetical protein
MRSVGYDENVNLFIFIKFVSYVPKRCTRIAFAVNLFFVHIKRWEDWVQASLGSWSTELEEEHKEEGTEKGTNEPTDIVNPGITTVVCNHANGEDRPRVKVDTDQGSSGIRETNDNRGHVLSDQET